MATSSEGVIDGEVNSGTTPGRVHVAQHRPELDLQRVSRSGWRDRCHFFDLGCLHPATGLFFAAARYHGFYSSPDGVNRTRRVLQNHCNRHIAGEPLLILSGAQW